MAQADKGGSSSSSIARLINAVNTSSGVEVQEMISVVEELENSSPDAFQITAYNRALIACAKAAKHGAGRMAMAYGFRVLQMTRDRKLIPNVHTFTPLVDTCAKVGAVKECELVLRMMEQEGVQPNIVTYSSFLSAFASAAARGRVSPSKVLQVLEDMRAAGLQPNDYTYCIAVDVCAASAVVAGASQAVELGKLVIAAMRRDGAKEDALLVAHNSLLKGCAAAADGDAGAVEEAFAVLREMKQTKVAPNVVTYTTLLNMLAQVADEESIRKSFSLLKKMEREGIEANTITYNVLLKACAKAARASVTPSRQDNTRQPTRGTQTKHRNLSLDYSNKKTEHSGAPANVESGAVPALRMLEMAEGVLEAMQGRGLQPDVYSFNTLLNICASVAASTRQVPREGMRVLDKMRSVGVVPSAEELGFLLEAARAAAEDGREDAMRIGIQLEHLMSNSKQPPAPRHAFADSSAHPAPAETPRAGMDNVVGDAVVVDAGATWEQAAIQHLNALTSSGLVDAAATAMQAKEMVERNGSADAVTRFEAAKNVVVKMVDASATAERVKSLGKLTRVERRGAMEKCMALLEDMVTAGIEPDGVTLTTVINAGKQEGSPTAVSKAYRVFQRMNVTGRSARMYTAMISALGQGGFPDEALRVLGEAEGGVGIRKMTVEMYTAAMQACARSKQHRHIVVQLHKRMTDRGLVGTSVTERILSHASSKHQGSHRQGSSRQGPYQGSYRRQGSYRQGSLDGNHRGRGRGRRSRH